MSFFPFFILNLKRVLETGRPATQDHRGLLKGDQANRQLFRLPGRKPDHRPTPRLFHRPARMSFLEYGQARPLWSEVFLHQRAGQDLGEHPPDQTTEDHQNSGYSFGRTTPTTYLRYATVELPGFLLHRLFPGLASWRKVQVHIRDAKGNKDRLVPLPENTLQILRNFWSVHRHSELLFPNRKRGLKNAHLVNTPLDRGGIQTAMKAVVRQLRTLAWRHQKIVYSLMFDCVQDTLKTFTRNNKKLGGAARFTTILHTHSRELKYHPHIHVVMPGNCPEKWVVHCKNVSNGDKAHLSWKISLPGSHSGKGYPAMRRRHGDLPLPARKKQPFLFQTVSII